MISSSASSGSLRCEVCSKEEEKEKSLYKCPTCGVRYCSVECYRTHSSLCSENFYKKNIDAHLKSEFVSLDDKRKMLRMLHNFEQQSLQQDADQYVNDDSTNTTERTDDDDLLEQLANVSVDDITFDHLTKEQQEKFKRDVAKGNIKVELWKPWWTVITKPKIIEIDSSTNDNAPAHSEISTIPDIYPTIPPLSSLTKAQPSPLLANNFINILYAYAFTDILFNGEMDSAPFEAVEALMILSPVLSKGIVYESVSTSVQQSVEISLQPTLASSAVHSISVLHDVVQLMSSKETTLAALSDLYRTLDAALHQTPDKQISKQVEAAKRKAFFFMSWANDLPVVSSQFNVPLTQQYALQSLQDAVIVEWESRNASKPTT